MSGWSVPALVDAVGGRLLGGPAGVPVRDVAIDSQRLEPGDAFVAIRGLRLDGHAFLEDAVRRGASCVVVSAPPARPLPVPVIVVRDTTEALADAARYHHRRLGVPVIAVTGSCGKTTTKELIAHLVGTPETVLKTFGTQNNHIGVPLTLLRMRPSHHLAVVELGSNHPGEIAALAGLAEPALAVITNVGPVHLEFFGSLLGVLEEKLSLLDALAPHGTAVLPGDQLEVCLEAPRHLTPDVRVVTFGTTDRCDIQATDIQRSAAGMLLRLRDQLTQWSLPVVGYHNVENALAAVACAWAVGVPLSVAKSRLTTFEPMPLRSEVVRCNGLTILNDCYNANPLSVARALETLRDMAVRRKIAIVGDMLELGDYTASAHRAIGRLATQLRIDEILAVGQYAGEVAEGAREGGVDSVLTYRTVPELLADLPSRLQQGDGLLVKGSRKLNLERVTDFLREHYRAAHA